MAQGLYTLLLRAEAALDSTFGRGRRLMLDGAVKGLEVNKGKFDGVLDVAATVRGSQGDMYQTGLFIDTDSCEFIDYSCTCPAAARYEGMCKHVVATALAALDETGLEAVEGLRNPVRTSRVDEASTGEGAAARRSPTSSTPRVKRPATPVNPNFPFPAPVPSSSSLMAALDGLRTSREEQIEEYRRELTPMRADSMGPKVFFDPTLASYYSPLFGKRYSWCLELRIRRLGVTYVVKDIAGVVDAWRRRDAFYFGSKLTMPLDPEAFDDVSTALMEMVCAQTDYLRDITSSPSAARDFSRAGFAPDRQLPVDEDFIVAMLDLFAGRRIVFDPEFARGTFGASKWEIDVVGAPGAEAREATDEASADESDGAALAAVPHVVLPAKITGSSDGTYDLRLPTNTCCFAGKDGVYLVDTKQARRTDDDFAAHAAPFFKNLMPTRGPIHIAAAEVPDFCRMALPVLRAYCDLVEPDTLRRVALKPAFAFTIGTDDGYVTCGVKVSYGDWEGDLFAMGAPGSEFEQTDPGMPIRDDVAEFRAMDTVGVYFDFFANGPSFDENDDERLFDLLTEGLAALAKIGEVMLSDRLRQIAVRPAPHLTVRTTVKSNLLDVELGASGLSRQDLIAYLDSYRRNQKFARLTTGDIVRLDESARAAFDLADDLGVTTVDLLDGMSLPASSTLFVDAMLGGAEGVEVVRDAAFKRAVKRLDSLGQENFAVPGSLKATLRGYQVDGFQWLESLEHLGLGGILADDMGLGKTLQVIAHVLARVEAGEGAPTLVVCPASLVYNWTAELERFAPTLDVAAIVGNKQQRRVAIAGASSHHVLVTSYDLMRRDIDEYAEQSFARVVLDEAQYIKNPLTQVARASKRLPAPVRFALTGTPIENRLSELWSIFDFLMPGFLGTHEQFAKRFESPVEHAEGSSANRLQALISPFVLRRVKEDVVADLPEKMEDVVMAPLEGEQRKLYLANQDLIAEQVQHRQPKEFKKEKLKVLAELTKLRQICCDPRLHYADYKGGSAKLETCMELVRTAVDGGHRILLFSQFTGMLDLIAARLDKEKLGYLKLTGATSKERRAQMVAEFQAGGVPVFLISLKAGGVGLNLTAADVVIHFDPWWNVAAQDQATDRAHRIGQKRTVTVYKLIARGTIEERILAMQESKRDLVESVLGGDSVASALFTRDDILQLLDARA